MSHHAYNANDVVGFVAGFLTTFSSLPQLVKVIRTKSAGDLSLGTIVMTNVGLILWTVYGFMIHNPPLIIWDMIAVSITGSVAIAKVYYERKERQTVPIEDIELIEVFPNS